MDNVTIDGTPFSVLLSQAVKLKTAQDGQSRSKYDTYPSFYKNSMFSREEVIVSRNKPFRERMEDATKWKDEGNVAIHEGHFIDAIAKYEIALSLFKYLENCNGNWKTEGIRDEDIVQNRFHSKNNCEMKEVQNFLEACYTNIAIAATKAKRFPLALDACNQVLQSNPSSVKALYLRSKALVAPKSAGTIEDDMAIRDLKAALKLDPQNKELRKEIAKLLSKRKHQVLHDRMTFRGMFDRGHVYEDKEVERKRPPDVSNYVQMIDFDNPTPNMIEDATNQGIDLTDVEIVKCLKALQAEKIKGEETCPKNRVCDRFCGLYKKSDTIKLKIVCFVICMIAYYLNMKWWNTL